MTGHQEDVRVVPRAAVMGDGWLGVRSTGIRETLETIRREGRFEPRQTMESDPSFKQIIPYLVLRDGDRWFLMRRTRAGGDARLHDLWSIGIGGHLNPGDQDVDGGLRREWHEELVADFEPDYRVVGLLNDDTTSVGQGHLGVVYVADANGRRVDIRETEKLAGGFATAAAVAVLRDSMESWSRLTFDALVQATPSNR